MKEQSWDGRLTNWYKKNLNLSGGYARKINRNSPSSIANSEYVKSDKVGLTIVARSGKRLSKEINTEPHYHHTYGNPQSAKKQYGSLMKRYRPQLKRYKL